MGKIVLLPETTKNPLELMGRIAAIAYGTDYSNTEKNIKRGKQCVLDNHGRMLEFPEVYYRAEGYSIKVAREIFRHVSDGLSCVQDSSRYCNFADFDYVIPPKIENMPEAKEVYVEAMSQVNEAYKYLLDLGIKREDASGVLPLNMTTKFTMRKNARSLADMSRVRLCNRAYHEFRDFMKDLIAALRDYSEEWNELADLIFMPKCQELGGYCTEHESCGKYPKKTIDSRS